jgi:hypothetical protein
MVELDSKQSPSSATTVEGPAIWQTFVEAQKRHRLTKRTSLAQPRTSSRNQSHVSSAEEAIVFQNALQTILLLSLLFSVFY